MLGVSNAEAEEYFTSLCIEDKSTGFNWRNGDWHQTNFMPNKYIVKKVKIDPTPGSDTFQCYEDMKGKKNLSFDGKKIYDYGCFNIRDYGDKFTAFYNQLCAQSYDDDENIKGVDCHMMNFQPNGAFIKSRFQSSLTSHPKNDYKDSLILSVGKCSVL